MKKDCIRKMGCALYVVENGKPHAMPAKEVARDLKKVKNTIIP